MLTAYVLAAMRHAKYEILSDDGSFYGQIPECPGVWASAATLEGCREELQSVLEDWIFIKLRHNDDDFALIDGVDLNPLPVSEQELRLYVEAILKVAVVPLRERVEKLERRVDDLEEALERGDRATDER